MPNELDSVPAAAAIGRKKIKATPQAASKITRDWPETIRKSALFSARTTRDSYLVQIKKNLRKIAAGETTPQVAADSLRRSLATLGYTPELGFPGDREKYSGEIPPALKGNITDLSSDRRIRLIVDTQTKQARSMGQLASSENPVFIMAYPAWRLERQGRRKKARADWDTRWAAAGRSVGWQGASRNEMVALKTSPIWTALGSGAGGFTDTLGLPYPPFAFGSGMAWGNVGRREWRAICEAEGIDNGLDGIRAEAEKLAKDGD